MRLFLLTWQTWDDSENLGIFSTREKAEEFYKNITKRKYCYYIEEFELDGLAGQLESHFLKDWGI